MGRRCGLTISMVVLCLTAHAFIALHITRFLFPFPAPKNRQNIHQRRSAEHLQSITVTTSHQFNLSGHLTKIERTCGSLFHHLPPLLTSTIPRLRAYICVVDPPARRTAYTGQKQTRPASRIARRRTRARPMGRMWMGVLGAGRREEVYRKVRESGF